MGLPKAYNFRRNCAMDWSTFGQLLREILKFDLGNPVVARLFKVRHGQLEWQPKKNPQSSGGRIGQDALVSWMTLASCTAGEVSW